MRVALVLTALVSLLVSPGFAAAGELLPGLASAGVPGLSNLLASYQLPEFSQWLDWLWQLVAHTLGGVFTQVHTSLAFEPAGAATPSGTGVWSMASCVITAGVVSSLALCAATVGYGFWLSVREH